MDVAHFGANTEKLQFLPLHPLLKSGGPPRVNQMSHKDHIVDKSENPFVQIFFDILVALADNCEKQTAKVESRRKEAIVKAPIEPCLTKQLLGIFDQLHN